MNTADCPFLNKREKKFNKMKEKKTDRRIQKTKKSLTEALIKLILEKGYEKVTIQNILDEANIGRSTFYFHYESKEQLLFGGPDNLNVKLFDDVNASGEIDFLNLFDHLAENVQLAKAMLMQQGGNTMPAFFRNNIALKVKKKYSSQFRKTKSDQKVLNYLSDAAGAAVMSLLVSWLEDDLSYRPGEISEKCQNMVSAIFAR